MEKRIFSTSISNWTADDQIIIFLSSFTFYIVKFFSLFRLVNQNLTPSSMWSLEPLLYASLPENVCVSILSDIIVIRGIYIMAMVLPFTYIMIHKILLKFNTRYRKMSCKPTKQVVVLHHVVESLVLSIFLPIFSFLMIKVNFQIHEFHETIFNLKKIVILIAGITMIYVIEIVSRLNEMRSMIVFHHFLAIMDISLGVMFPSSVMLKTGTVLAYFICFESFIFIGLFMYRVFPQNRMTPKVILFGAILFGISRPLQVLWIGAIIIGLWNHEDNVRWIAIVQVLLTVIFTLLQSWSLKIHIEVWKRCKRNIRNESTSWSHPDSKKQLKAENTDSTVDKAEISSTLCGYDSESGGNVLHTNQGSL